MRIRFSTNLGGGFSKDLEVPDGTTVRELCLRESLKPNFEAFLIRVKRQEVGESYRLKDGDRVSVTPRSVRAAFEATSGGRLDQEQETEDLIDLEAIERAKNESGWVSWESLKAELDL